jgi:hypothetical protein
MLVSVGHENSVEAGKVIALARPNSMPIRRLVSNARDRGTLIDLCAGKACRSVIIVESGHTITSSLRPQVLRERLNRAVSPMNHIASEPEASEE